MLRREPAADPLTFLLVDSDKENDSVVFAIRMVPNPQFGGALTSVGAAVPIAWSALREEGLGALNTIRQIAPDAAANTDFAPKTGRFRRRRVVIASLEDGTFTLSPERLTSKNKGLAAERQRLRITLPVSSKELEDAIREALSRARVR